MTGIENEPHILHAPPVVKILGDRERGEQLRGRALQLLRITKDQNFQDLPVWQMTYHQNPLTGEMAAPGPGTDVFVCSVAHGQEQVIVQAAAVGEMQETPENPPPIEPDEPRPEEEAQDFLVFYKHEGITKLAVFNITTGSVIRKLTLLGDADTAVLTRKDTGVTLCFRGVDSYVVLYEKELEKQGIDGRLYKQLLMACPFTVNNNAWSYTYFDCKYTDPWMYKDKFIDEFMSTLHIVYGVYSPSMGNFREFGIGGNPFSGSGFSYDQDTVAWYSGIDLNTSKQILTTVKHYDANNNFKLIESNNWKTDSAMYGFSNGFKLLYPHYHSNGWFYSNALGLRFFSELSPDKLSAFQAVSATVYDGVVIPQGGTYARWAYGDTGAPWLFLKDNADPVLPMNGGLFESDWTQVACDSSRGRHPVSMHSIDGRRFRYIPWDLESMMWRAYYRTGWYKLSIDGVVAQEYDGGRISSGEWRDLCQTSGSATYHPFVYRYELGGSLLTSKVARTLMRTQKDGYSWSDAVEIRVGGKLLVSTSSDFEQILPSGDGRLSGQRVSLCPLAFPFGLRSDSLFALKSTRRWDHTRTSASLDPFPFPEIKKYLLVPYENEISIDNRGRPMGWFQIQTLHNKHVLQGILVVDDEYGDVYETYIWHNGTRLENRLASRLGVGTKDILGMLYIPKSQNIKNLE